jgi:hypothetical protein
MKTDHPMSRLPDPEDVTRLLELVRRCETSRATRQTRCETLRRWYENGSPEGGNSRYNKLFSHINIVCSFLFSPGTVRFGAHLPPSVREQWLEPAAIARDEFREMWEESGSDTLLLSAIEWALVYGGTILKVQPDHPSGFRIGYVQPWDFGVSREDVKDLDEQDTVCHWYTLSMPQVERWIGHEPAAEELTDLIHDHARPGRAGTTRNRLVISSITGVFPGGNISGGFPGPSYTDARSEAMVEEPTVEFVDLWERRTFKSTGRQGEEKFEDWLVTTFLVDANKPIAQRRNPDLPSTKVTMGARIPAELPFVALTPRPVPDYFWGRSELDNLTMLQEWLDDHVGDLKSIVKRQLNPPKFFSGVADFEEAGRAMDTAGGSYGSVEPTAKMDKLVPPLGQETLKIFDMILAMFNDISGVPASITEPAAMPGGVRATGHFSMAAGIGAGRLRQMALVIEKILGEVATKGFHLLQRTSTDLFRREDKSPFLLSQIPHMVTLSVNAHSSSPIFAEQTQAKAMMLQRAGALSPEDFVELLDPPNRDELKARAKKIGQQKAEMSHEVLEIQKEKARSKGAKALPKK